MFPARDRDAVLETWPSRLPEPQGRPVPKGHSPASAGNSGLLPVRGLVQNHDAIAGTDFELGVVDHGLFARVGGDSDLSRASLPDVLGTYSIWTCLELAFEGQQNFAELHHAMQNARHSARLAKLSTNQRKDWLT